MCLWLSEVNTNSFVTNRRTSNKKTFTAYKVVQRRNGGLYSIVFKHRWKVGQNISNRHSKLLTRTEVLDNAVNEGIHVYLKKSTAKAELSFHNPTYTILEVRCHVNDVIAVNDFSSQAVLNKVNITSRSYHKAHRKVKEN